MRLLLKNAHLYRHESFSDTDVLIEDGIIKKIGACNEEADKVIDLHGALLSHNFIDIHTHLREPGFEHKETISTGSASALYDRYDIYCEFHLQDVNHDLPVYIHLHY